MFRNHSYWTYRDIVIICLGMIIYSTEIVLDELFAWSDLELDYSISLKFLQKNGNTGIKLKLSERKL